MSGDAAESSLDEEIWTALRAEAEAEAARTPLLAGFLKASVLSHGTLASALSRHLADRLAAPSLPASAIHAAFEEKLSAPDVAAAIRTDLKAVRQRDPATRDFFTVLLYFKGFLALQTYRVAHALWNEGAAALAIYLQNRASERFAVDIHPAARIGRGILLDHGTSIVIGETAVVGDDVSMLHEVTLGGTGKQSGDRHPKIGRGVLIGAGAKVLGNLRVGDGAKIGAGSVVLDDVPPHTTVAGVPARIVGRPESAAPALDMNQQFPHNFHDGGGI